MGLAEGAVQWGIITANDYQGVYYFKGPAIDNSVLAQQQAQAGQIALPAARRQTQPAPIDRRVLAQFYPAEVIDLKISGEFRHVVNLLVCLAPAFTESQLQAFLGAVFALQRMYGGVISRLDFGDKGTNLLIF